MGCALGRIWYGQWGWQPAARGGGNLDASPCAFQWQPIRRARKPIAIPSHGLCLEKKKKKRSCTVCAPVSNSKCDERFHLQVARTQRPQTQIGHPLSQLNPTVLRLQLCICANHTAQTNHCCGCSVISAVQRTSLHCIVKLQPHA